MRRDGDAGDGRGLEGGVALVTGASRGVGRGIAHELGLAGATVFVTGRSREEGESTEGLPGTVDGTARLVTDAVGRGVAVECDHTVERDVERLAERLRKEAGRRAANPPGRCPPPAAPPPRWSRCPPGWVRRAGRGGPT